MHCPRPLGAGEEAGGRAGWGSKVEPYGVETGEGGCPLPVSPTPNGDIPLEAVFGLLHSLADTLGRCSKILDVMGGRAYECSRMRPRIPSRRNSDRSRPISGTRANLSHPCTFAPRHQTPYIAGLPTLP